MTCSACLPPYSNIEPGWGDDYPSTAVDRTATPSNPEQGVTPLIVGQDYLDIVFANVKRDAAGNPFNGWNFVRLYVRSNVEPPTMKIFATVTSSKTSTGARVYFNSAPDTTDYILEWELQ